MTVRRVATFAYVTCTEPKHIRVESLESLHDWLLDHLDAWDENPPEGERRRARKNALLSWSPASYAKGETRARDAVESVALAAFDLDEDPIEPVLGRLQAAGIGYLAYESPTSRLDDPDHSKWRLILWPDRPWTAPEHEQVYAYLVRAFEIPIDPQTKNADRVFFVPVTRPGFEPEFLYRPGTPVPIPTEFEPSEPDPDAPKVMPSPEALKPLVRKTLHSLADRQAAKALDRIKRAQPGERNSTMNEAAFHLGQIAWATTSPETLRKRMRSAIQTRNDPTYEPEAERTTERAFEQGRANPEFPHGITLSDATRRVHIPHDQDPGKELTAILTKALADFDQDLYQRSGQLVRGTPMPKLQPLTTKAQIHEHLATYVKRQTFAQAGDAQPVAKLQEPPLTWSEQLLGQGDFGPIRRLTGIVHSPTLLRDGRVLQTPGYDAESGLFVHLTRTYPQVPDRPTRAQALAAAGELVGLFTEFEFADPQRQAWASVLANILTIPARTLYDGPAPLFAYDATTPGSGKGLAAAVVSWISLAEYPTTVTPSGQDETRKLITSAYQAARRVVVFDNADTTLGNRAMCSAITEGTWSDRILGQTKQVEFPNTITFMATGNNIQLAADLTRRTIPIRNEPRTAQPERRTFSRDLMVYTIQHQPRLAIAALTILRAWLQSHHDEPVPILGGFPGWSQIVRGAVLWLGFPDPVPAVSTLASYADSRVQQIESVVRWWLETFPDGKEQSPTTICARVTAEQLSEAEGALLELSHARAGSLNPVLVGKALGHIRGRLVLVDDKVCCFRANRTKHGIAWHLEVISGG